MMPIEFKFRSISFIYFHFTLIPKGLLRARRSPKSRFREWGRVGVNPKKFALMTRERPSALTLLKFDIDIRKSYHYLNCLLVRKHSSKQEVVPTNFFLFSFKSFPIFYFQDRRGENERITEVNNAIRFAQLVQL